MSWGCSCSCHMGLSAAAIKYPGAVPHHPHDGSDLRRCVEYCVGASITTEALQIRMAGRSIYWDRLLPEWDMLVDLLAEEAARVDGWAPRTYRAMRRVLDAGVECGSCYGTGTGEQCDKCKGTGRRSGGQCRAPECRDGFHNCPTCKGRGYTRTKEAA